LFDMHMIIIRLANKADAPLVIQKVEQLVTELAGESFSLNASKLLPSIEQAIDSDRYIVLLASDNEANIVGILTLGETFAAYAGGLFGVIHELHVVENTRSSGIGKDLLNEAKTICQQKGWARLEVGAPYYPEWSRTKKFYIREGFVEIGPRLKWIVEHRDPVDSQNARD